MYLNREGEEIILVGDTNCDLTKQAAQSTDNQTRHLTYLYELFSLNQIVEVPARVTVNTSSIVHHIASNCTKNIIKSRVYKVAMSDHFMVYFVRKVNGAVQRSSKVIKTQRMNNFKE